MNDYSKCFHILQKIARMKMKNLRQLKMKIVSFAKVMFSSILIQTLLRFTNASSFDTDRICFEFDEAELNKAIESIFGDGLSLFRKGTLCLYTKDQKAHVLARRNFNFYNFLKNDDDGHFERKYNYRLTRPQIPFRIGGSIGKKRIIYQKYIS
ncbi:hypothetical protein BpHYR1_032014 [Brachionus plicatilis]|uniref:Uncharacterized protein n=1 Tax=Brachionus plicatilis TaxID=10195 RepID=A0A3M7T1I4_BRAPC|nr:hypothetical protein BpHYR1_032014 [Brachionus plicatilis]